MDELEESQQQQEEVIDSADQMVYGVPHYLAARPGGVATAVPVSAPTGSSTRRQQPAAAAYSQAQHFYQQQQLHRQNQLQSFWANQMQEIEQTTDFKNHSLPLARIKKIMKSDEDVRMISSEAPVMFAKACEMFILELTLRSWLHTEESKRRTLQKNDIAAAISRTDVFDFLVDIIPRDELREEGLGVTNPATVPLLGPPADSVPYYYVPQQHAVGQAGLFYPNQQPHQHQNQDEENGN